MRCLIRAAVLVLMGAASAAFAADLSAPPLPTTKGPLGPAYNWSGFYVGVNAGGDWYGGNGFVGGGNVRSLFPTSSLINVPSTVRGSSAGLTAGGLAGYNYRIGGFVLGAETDFDAINSRSDSSGSTSILCCETFAPEPIAPIATPPAVPASSVASGALPTRSLPPAPFFRRPASVPIYATETLSHASRSQLNWFGTARVRFGYLPTERLLVYGTGGLAYGEVQGNLERSNVFSGIVTSRFWQGSDSDVKVGWTLGAGAEYALTSAISIRAEYLYLDLGRSTVTANYAGLFPASGPQAQIFYTSSHDNKFNVARAAVAYKF